MLKQINLEELDAALLSSIFITKCDLRKALNQGPSNYIFYDLITESLCENITAVYHVRRPDRTDAIIVVEEDSISLYIKRMLNDGEESYNIYRGLTHDNISRILYNLFEITINTPLDIIKKHFTSEQRTHVRNEVIVFSKPGLVIIVDLVNNEFRAGGFLWCDLNFENVIKVLKESENKCIQI